MNTISFLLGLLALIGLNSPARAAELKSGWQAEWEMALAGGQERSAGDGLWSAWASIPGGLSGFSKSAS